MRTTNIACAHQPNKKLHNLDVNNIYKRLTVSQNDVG